MGFNDILLALPTLTKQQLKTLRLAIDSLSNDPIKADSSFDLELFDVMQTVTKERVALVPFKASANYKLWMESQLAFHQLLNKIIGTHSVTQVHRIALKKHLMELITAYLKDNNLPITLRSICIHLGNIEKIVDGAYPDYLENGLGGLILTALKRGQA